MSELDKEALANYSLRMKTRLNKTEADIAALKDDMNEIKRGIRMLMGMVFTLNTTIIGLLAKSIELF